MKFRVFFVIIFMIVGVIFIHEFRGKKIGDYTIKKSERHTPAFNYILIGYDKNNSGFIEYFINDYIVADGYLYYTYISAGAGLDGWCYLDDRLILSRINIKEKIIERDIDFMKYEHIYKEINFIHDSDAKWLSELNNKCVK